MATLASPRFSSTQSPTRMSRRWARKCERYCCLGVRYFPLVFVYSMTTWAVWVESTIGFLPAKDVWIGKGTSIFGIILYTLLNWSYTTAVFTSPGTTTSGNNGYSSLPTQAPRATNFTVKSNGEMRYCKKCQARKPDRAHHCSTCRTCVLKMDHHCPWLATCVGLRNYKAFLLFLIYTTLFCFLCFGVSARWVWREIMNEGEYTESLMPVNYVMLAVISGIIGLVLGGFTGWHILLASRGQTTIECLEKTRYLSPVRKAMHHQHPTGSNNGPDFGQQLSDMSPDGTVPYGIPGGIEEQQIQGQPTRQQYDAHERRRARERYEEYLDEQDAEKLPSAFDLGWKMNLLHLFGTNKALWWAPIVTTLGDGWSWEPSPKWLAAREAIAHEREAQRERERVAGWGEQAIALPPLPERKQSGAGRHYVSSYPTQAKADRVLGRPSSKADRILGRMTDEYADTDSPDSSTNSISMQNLRPLGNIKDPYGDISSDEEDFEERVLDRKVSVGWPQKVGVVTNTLLGNTLARQKDDIRGWDGQDEGVD